MAFSDTLYLDVVVNRQHNDDIDIVQSFELDIDINTVVEEDGIINIASATDMER